MAKYYHGGSKRLPVGGLLLTGQRPNGWGDTFDDRGRSVFIYCTTDLSTARSYADAVRKTGRRAYVYGVRPLGQLLRDCNSRDFKSTEPLEITERII